MASANASSRSGANWIAMFIGPVSRMQVRPFLAGLLLDLNGRMLDFEPLEQHCCDCDPDSFGIGAIFELDMG